MNPNFMNSILSPAKPPDSVVSAGNDLKAIVFPVGLYTLALPISLVLKVIPCPPISHRSSNGLGIVNFGDQTITIIDLHFKLASSSQLPTNGSDQMLQPTQSLTSLLDPQSNLITPLHDQPLKQAFLILSQTRQGELCGIPVATPPAWIEIPKQAIRELPLSYRHSHPLGIASHSAILPRSNGSIEIFILGLKNG